jgi:hypothetical protein
MGNAALWIVCFTSAGAAIALASASLNAQSPATRPAEPTRAENRPLRLMLQPDPGPVPQETIYAPPPVAQSSQGYNEGALSLDITGRYMTDYIFRGLELVEPPGSEDAINVQFDALLTLDLGELPDPFVRIFTNTAEGDDISNFQVIRPSVGIEWETEAFTLAAGNQSFTYPDRTELDTSEVFATLTINDGLLFGEDEPILSPYVFAAYDYDTFNGTYVAAGVSREFQIPESNFSGGIHGLVAYVNDLPDLYGIDTVDPEGSGFSHYQVGARLHYDLNSLLNISRRYGQWGVEGYLNYTDGLDSDLAVTPQLWGGAGITFRY